MACCHGGLSKQAEQDSCRRSTMQFKVLQVRHQPSDQGEVGDIWDPCHDVNAIHSLVHSRRLGLWASHIATCLLGGLAAALTTLLSCHPTHRRLLRGVIRGLRESHFCTVPEIVMLAAFSSGPPSVGINFLKAAEARNQTPKHRNPIPKFPKPTSPQVLGFRMVQD